jgi:cell division protein FtsW (lipid II flippase)
MFWGIAESAAMVFIILLLVLFLPSRFMRAFMWLGIVVLLLLMLAVPFLPQFF